MTLGDQVFDHRRLLSVQPTANYHQQELQKSRRRSHLTPMLAARSYNASSAEFWNITTYVRNLAPWLAHFRYCTEPVGGKVPFSIENTHVYITYSLWKL